MSQNRQLFTIHLGTYEGQLLGLHGTLKKLSVKYSFSASPGCIKALDIGHAHQRFLFVAGYDESIKIFDCKRFKNLGAVDGHQASILCLRSFANTLFSGDEEGKILVWQHKTWALLQTHKEHEAAVVDLFVHPSGKIMLSISRDNRLFVWNLLNGTKVYQRRFAINLHKVLMYREQYILLLSDKLFTIMRSADNKEIKRIECQNRLNDFALFNEFIIVGDDEGWVRIYQLSTDEENINDLHVSFKAHTQRVKCLRIVEIDAMQVLITCSTNGEVKIWDVLEQLVKGLTVISQNEDLADRVKPIYQIQTEQRLTSMAVNVVWQKPDLEQSSNGKQKQKVNKQVEKSIVVTKKINKRRNKKKIRKGAADNTAGAKDQKENKVQKQQKEHNIQKEQHAEKNKPQKKIEKLEKQKKIMKIEKSNKKKKVAQ